MIVHLKNVNKYFGEEKKIVLKNFIKMMQSQMPLLREVYTYFIDYRKDDMTTGLRNDKHELYVLSKNRLFIDILRTLAHEWCHEFEHQKLGVKDEDIGKEVDRIGSPEENLSNVLAGIMTKKFDNDYPQYKKIIYGED